MRPVNHAALGVPFVLSVELDRVARLQRRGSIPGPPPAFSARLARGSLGIVTAHDISLHEREVPTCIIMAGRQDRTDTAASDISASSWAWAARSAGATCSRRSSSCSRSRTCTATRSSRSSPSAAGARGIRVPARSTRSFRCSRTRAWSPASKVGGKRVFSLTDAGREYAETLPDQAPWDATTSDGDPTRRLREVFSGLMAATAQVGRTGNREQIEKTADILTEARKRIYELLATTSSPPHHGGRMKSSQLRARYWRIVFFFGRVTAGFIFWEIFLPRIGLGGWSARTRSERNRRIAVRFRALAIRMGGLMIKVGPVPLGTPRRAAGRDHRRARRPARRGPRRGASRPSARRPRPSWAQPLSEHYAWFDETPLAAASLGQVHRARLCEPTRPSCTASTDVVVKVQRPHIEQIVEVDLAALRRVGGWLQRYKPVSERADVPRAGRGVRHHHARGDRLPRRGQQRRDVRAPTSRTTRASTCPRSCGSSRTRRVLTLEDVSAIKLGDYEAITAAGHRPLGRSPRCCSTPTCSRSSRTASSTPTRTPATCSSRRSKASTRTATATGS